MLYSLSHEQTFLPSEERVISEATYSLKSTSGAEGEGFVSLVGNADSQNKLNKCPLIEECCLGLGLIKIRKSKRLKCVRLGLWRDLECFALPSISRAVVIDL